MYCSPVTVIFGIAVTLKVNCFVGSDARVAITCTGPLAVDARRTVFEVCPFAPVVVELDPSVAAAVGETVQLMVAPASPTPAVLFNCTTRGAPNACPA